MPRKSKFDLPPLNLGQETIGQRLARLRKERGYTQSELADKIGIIRELISEYERDKIRLHYDMVIRLALALEVSADELLGMTPSKNKISTPSLKIQRRMKQIEKLPSEQQKTLLKTIDTFIKAARI